MFRKIREISKGNVRIGFVAFFTAILLISGILASCSAPESTTTQAPESTTTQEPEPTTTQEVITLKYSTPYPDFADPTLLAYRIFDYVEQETNGRVKVDSYPGGALGGTMEHLMLVSSGAVDLVTLMPESHPAELPLNCIGNNLVWYGTQEECVAAVYALQWEIPETSALLQEEQRRNNIMIFHVPTAGLGAVWTRDQCTSLADLEGKKIVGGIDSLIATFEEFGLHNIDITIPEYYEAMSRGVVDACHQGTGGGESYRLYEVAKSCLQLPAYVGVTIPTVINLQTWEGLPSDVQQVFLEAADESALWSCELARETLRRCWKTFKEAGLNVTLLPTEEAEMFAEILAETKRQVWLDNCEKCGFEYEASVILEHYDEIGLDEWQPEMGLNSWPEYCFDSE